MIVRVELSTMSGCVKCVRHGGDDVCCSVVCPCKMVRSVWMWCLEEVYTCLQL